LYSSKVEIEEARYCLLSGLTQFRCLNHLTGFFICSLPD